MTKYLVILVAGLLFCSCNRIKRKGHEAIDQTKEKIRNKRDAAVDKIIPTFNSYQPDSRYNKKRFEEFFGFAPTPDVRDIYCFDDQMGIDSKFIFSFTCDSTTRNRIVKHAGLVLKTTPDNYSSGLWENFPWWDSAKIVTLKPYWRKSEHALYEYLWFDKDKQKVYYINFDR